MGTSSEKAWTAWLVSAVMGEVVNSDSPLIGSAGVIEKALRLHDLHEEDYSRFQRDIARYKAQRDRKHGWQAAIDEARAEGVREERERCLDIVYVASPENRARPRYLMDAIRGGDGGGEEAAPRGFPADFEYGPGGDFTCSMCKWTTCQCSVRSKPAPEPCGECGGKGKRDFCVTGAWDCYCAGGPSDEWLEAHHPRCSGGDS